jgi:hypothetical protein
VLVGAFLFNLGQGVLRPTLPLYLRTVFSANYRMVTLIPVVFGAGKWVANLPTGYFLDRLGRRRLMVGGLILIALRDLGSAMASGYGLFLILRALAGVGWAAFSTVATTTMVDQSSAGRRGRAVSLLFHKVREVYLIQWEQPQLVVDITDAMDQKLQAIICHASQVSDWKSVETRMRTRAATLGASKGYTYAEGFDHVVLQV